ncbi:MAG: D-alanyl-D-alanine carboxypeptidase family protein [Eubacterium sp.]|jgi:D-alanyl-D-alanine carboxypeptidase
MTDYLIVVNSKNPMPKDFIDTVELVKITNDRGTEFELEKETCEHYKALKKYLAEKENIIVDLDSAYRDEAYQQRIWDEFTEKFGPEYAEKYAAVPGTSEHHTGLALDVCLIKDGKVIDDNDEMNAETEIFGRIYPVLPQFGFIHRYSHECWHYRYVGSPKTAKAIADSGLTLEQYVEREKATDRLLEGGKTLVYLKRRFQSKKTREQLEWLEACLHDSVLIVPVLPVSGKPDFLEDDEGKRYLPVFSQEEQMPEDYASEFDLKNMTFEECYKLAKSFPDVVAIELDGFTEPFTISFDMAEVILKTPSRRY